MLARDKGDASEEFVERTEAPALRAIPVNLPGGTQPVPAISSPLLLHRDVNVE